ncbi:MAG: tRNA lysidine(34) synthetase TilS, partial [Bacteroidetes bacterium]
MSTPHEAEGLPEQVRRFMAEQGLPEPGEAVLVGLSGGVDSVVLTVVLQRLGYRVAAAHVNYRLRGAASEEDEAWVRAFCREQRVPCHVRRLAEGAVVRVARGTGGSVQAAARTLRYAYFEERARRLGLRWVAVAHHLDDQAETVLLHLLRGTGVEGMAGMPVARPIRPGSPVRVMRPLLGVRRHAIEAFARHQGLGWREDASNTHPRYRRGVLRAEVLPLLEARFGAAVVPNLARTAALVRGYV